MGCPWVAGGLPMSCLCVAREVFAGKPMCCPWVAHGTSVCRPWGKRKAPVGCPLTAFWVSTGRRRVGNGLSGGNLCGVRGVAVGCPWITRLVVRG